VRWSEVGFCGGILSVCEAENDGVPHLDRCFLSEELFRREDFVVKNWVEKDCRSWECLG
jgi:hypothetical protein